MNLLVPYTFLCSSLFFSQISSFAQPPCPRGVVLTPTLHNPLQSLNRIKGHRNSIKLFGIEKDIGDTPSSFSVLQDYVSTMRPITLIQAVGAWVVGRLAVLRGNNGTFQSMTSVVKSNLSVELWALLAVFLSYGVGMVANDCADALVDGQAITNNSSSCKSKRAIASGRIGKTEGWIFAVSLSMVSLMISFWGVSPGFGVWCASNIFLMVLYALELQRLLLVKNLLVGWLCISPLWGATTMTTPILSHLVTSKSILQHQRRMVLLAAAGFSLGVIREILKDIEDVDLDRGTKLTLPLVVGTEAARKFSFVALGATLVLLQSPLYRRLFTSPLPMYSTGWVVATTIYIRALCLPKIQQQQSCVKRMIYVLLLSLIGSMVAQ